MSNTVDLFKIPKRPDVISIPAVLGLIYMTTYSTSSPFLKARSSLPAWFDKVFPVLFYVHIAESLLAGFRSVSAGRPLTETVKWMMATMVWGFASLGTQKAQLRKIGR